MRWSTAPAIRSASVSGGFCRHPLDLDARFGEAGELAAQAVELAGRRHQAASPAGQLERRQESDHEVVRAGTERDVARGVSEQAAEPGAHLVGPGGGDVPLVIDELGGVVERLELAVPGHVGPRLVRVPGQQEPLGHPEAGVVRRQRVGRVGETVEGDHSSLRMAQRSGNTGIDSVVRRYGTPDDPPVPAFEPMVRSTIFTWR